MARSLYHEKQVSALCGVHAINTLLQSPIFTEFDLAQIAQELDAMERQLMTDGGIGEGVGNVANDGMFSIQVLSKALQNWGLSITSLDNPDVLALKSDPHSADAFICNLQEHWFSIRKVDGEWWNFNSLFPAPQPVTQFYLSAFLDSLKDQGYMIFVVCGTLPTIPGDSGSSDDGPGRWFSPQEARHVTEEATAARQRGKVTNALEDAFSRAEAGGGTMQLRSKRKGGPECEALGLDNESDPEIVAAILASLMGGEAAGPSGSGASPAPIPHMEAAGFSVDEDNDADLAAAIKASLEGISGSSSAATAVETSNSAPVGSALAALGQDSAVDFGEDADLAAAIAASLADVGPGAAGPSDDEASANATVPQDPEPDEGAGVIELKFRGPDNEPPKSRRFSVEAGCSQLHQYIRSELATWGSKPFKIFTIFPRQEVLDGPMSLKEAGIKESQLLNIMSG